MDIKHYSYVFKCLDKIRKTCENLIEQNVELSNKNRELIKQHETDVQREIARERVLATLVKQQEGESHELPVSRVGISSPTSELSQPTPPF